MQTDKLKAILAKHSDWLEGKQGGERANLQSANLHKTAPVETQ